VTQHDRNVPDDVLRLVRENEGVVMVNYLTSYVSEPRRLYEVDVANYRKSLDQSLSEEAVRAAVNDYRKAHPAPEATLFDVADHIDHIRAIAGIDAIGLGADYDGMPPGPTGLEDVSTYPALLKELLIRGYSDRDIAKIAGENVLRVLEQAERVAARLQETTPPNDVLIDELDTP
jgi:membrane dipeptidase